MAFYTLSQNEFDYIKFNPECIYAVKKLINEDDLERIFSNLGGTSCEKIFKTFMRAGLSVNKITPRVQMEILRCFSGFDKSKALKMFMDAKVQISQDAIEHLMLRCPWELLHSGIKISRELLSRGIMQNDAYTFPEIWTYLSNNKDTITLTDEEQWCLISCYLPAFTSKVDTGVDHFFKTYFPFSRKVQELIVANSKALELLATKKQTFVNHLPADLRIKAIHTLPTKEFFDLMTKDFTNKQFIDFVGWDIDKELSEFVTRARDSNNQQIISAASELANKINARQTKNYISVLKTVEAEKSVPLDFKVLDEDVILQLLKTKMDRIHRYKMIENILKGRSYISKEMLLLMMSKDMFVMYIIKQLRPELLQKQQPEIKKRHGLFTKFRERGE